MPQEILARPLRLFLDLFGHAPKPRQLRASQIIQELLRFLRSNLERFGKPEQQTSINQRVADDEHEDDRQERNGHSSQNHFRFEASAELFSAAFYPKPQRGAREDKSEHEERSGNETRHGIEHPALRFEGHVQRAERENSREQQRQQDSADDQPPSLPIVQMAHGKLGEEERSEIEKSRLPQTSATILVGSALR